MSDEGRLTQGAKVGQKFDEIRAQHREWFDEFESVDPQIAPMNDVYRLLETAPNEFALGMMSAYVAYRNSLAALTGREHVAD